MAEYEDHFVEQHVKHSNALHSLLRERGSYLVGPLARFNLNFSRLPDVAQQAARECGLAVPCRNPFRGIVVRAIEMVFACWEALRILREYRQPASPRADVPVRAGAGCAATEAPRGTLYHRYEIDDRGSDSPRQNRAADFPEPEADRGRSLALRSATGRPPERRSHLEVRAGDPQLRSMHLLRHALFAASGRAGVTSADSRLRKSGPCRRRRRPAGRPKAPRAGDTGPRAWRRSAGADRRLERRGGRHRRGRREEWSTAGNDHRSGTPGLPLCPRASFAVPPTPSEWPRRSNWLVPSTAFQAS